MPNETTAGEIPVVAILRGVQPERVVQVADVVWAAGIRIIEVPLNSPDPFTSVAALAAARNGADVCLIEKGYGLGGLATFGLIAIFLPLCDGNGHQVIGGIPEELFNLALRYGPGSIPDCWKEGGSMEERAEKRLSAEFNPAWLMIAIEDLLVKSGVKIYYDTRICSTVKEDGRISAVIVENKRGRMAVSCKAVVDATGDADVCFFSGEETVSLDSNRRAAWFYSKSHNDVKLHILGDIFHQPVPEGPHDRDIGVVGVER